MWLIYIIYFTVVVGCKKSDDDEYCCYCDGGGGSDDDDHDHDHEHDDDEVKTLICDHCLLLPGKAGDLLLPAIPQYSPGEKKSNFLYCTKQSWN